jgi:alpha-mannosidase
MRALLALIALLVPALLDPTGASAQTLASPQAPAWGSPLMPAPTSSEPSKFISGYAKDVRGEVVRHDSPHPDANSALIAHAADPSHNTIEWDSAPVPDDARGPVVLRLVWNLATTVPQAGARWSVYAGDTKLATLDIPQSGVSYGWNGVAESQTLPGVRVELHLYSFDRHSDPGGHLYIQLPPSLYTAGRPVRLRIVGEVAVPLGPAEAAKRDPWLMVFRYDAQTRVSVRAEPALVRHKSGGISQQLRIDATCYSDLCGMEIARGGGGEGMPLQRGFNTIRVGTAPVRVEEQVPLRIRIDGRELFNASVSVAPVKQVSIYLLHHSHLDIGYTHVQRDVATMQARNLEQALTLIEKTRDYPADARFKWNVEGFWAVEAFLATATPEQKAQLREAMRARQIEIGPLYGNMLTGLAQPEELTRMTEEARRFARDMGVPATSAWISDVPGYTWGVVPALVQNGIKYFSLGTNTGDRIGHIIERLGDRPFYWRSASGQEKLLCWLHQSGYSYFHTGLSYSNRANLLTEDKLFGYLRQVQAGDRPSYDLLPLRYNIGSDNGPPDDRLADLVRAWNEKYISPHLVVSTMTEFFTAFEERHGATLPVYDGELTPYWEDGAYSTARESIANQASAARLEQAETFWALRAPAAFPADRFREAWRSVLLFNEHTWGSWNSISAPESPFTKSQWETKRAFAVEGERQSGELLDASLGAAPPAGAPVGAPLTSVDVFNSLSWSRTDLVTVPASYRPAGDRVIDAVGRPVPSQRLSTGELVFLASNVPPLGAKRFRFVLQPEATPGGGDTASVSVDEARATISGNGGDVELDPASGAIRTITGVPGSGGLNRYLYQAGREPGNEKAPSTVRITVGERGPLVASLIAESAAPGTNLLRQEVRLVAGVSRVDIIDTIDKRNVYDPEGVYFAFPFDIPDPQTRLGVVHGFYRPGTQQLPGSCKNYFTVRNWLDVSNAERGVTLVSPDALLVELGRITTDANRVGWLDEAGDSSTIYSYAMNNFWGTNYKAGQDGPTTFRYTLVPHARFDAAAAYKAGLEATHPLVMRPTATPTAATTRRSAAPVRAPFRLRNRNVIVSGLRPSDDGRGVMVTLFNAGEHPERPVLGMASTTRRLRTLPPFGVVTVYLRNTQLPQHVHRVRQRVVP